MKDPLLLIGGREPSWGFTWVELPSWETLDEGTKVDHPLLQEELGPLTPIGKLMETVCLNMSLQNRSGYVQTMFASCLR